MNENIDLTKILKNCPKGTKFYSTVLGEIKFIEIIYGAIYPIIVSCDDGKTEAFMADGKLILEYDGECVLFPSKDQRDWNKFTAIWYKNLTEPKFCVGQYITDGYVAGQIISIDDNYSCYKILSLTGGINSSIPFIVQNNYHLWSIQDAKDGDILTCNDEILLFKSSELKEHISLYCWYNGLINKFYSKEVNDILLTTINKICPATKEQRDLLFQKLKEAGYKWNAKTKTLEKLVKPKFKVGNKIIYTLRKYRGLSSQCIISEITDDKYIFTDGSYILISDQDSWELVPDKKQKFDPKTLKPFDKVLGRGHDSRIWKCNLFSHMVKNEEHPCKCSGAIYKYCIPYNDDTRHLVGTTDEAPEYYRYWED